MTLPFFSFASQIFELPNGNQEFQVPNLCMRGTASNVRATSIVDCQPMVINKPLTSYSPVNPASAQAFEVIFEESDEGLKRNGIFNSHLIFYLRFDNST